MQNVDNTGEGNGISTLLPAADERADQTGHALFRTKDAVPSPGHGNQTLNRKS